ncbi:MAG: collagen-binding domain-containing protein [Phycisphaerales bacterium]
MMIRPRSVSALLLCGVAGSTAALAPSAEASLLTDWNLVVRNNLSGSSEVDGSTLVGGSVFGTMNFGVQGITAPNGTALAVGGNFPAGSIANLGNAGDFRYAGALNGTVNNAGSLIFDPSIPSAVDSIFSQAAIVSAATAALPSTGSLDGAGNLTTNPANLLSIDGQQVAVYSFNITALNGLGQLNLNFGSADTVILNVTANGSGIVNFTAPPNLVGGFSQANSSRILWNFLDAESLIVNNNLNGAVLAPDAALSLNGGGINGAVIVDSVSNLDAEIRRFTYEGVLVPTPGAGAMLALAGIMTARRRRV